MPRTVIPPAWSETIISSSCDSRRLPVGTRRGVNVPLRSLGMRNSTSPAVVPTVFGNDPFLELPLARVDLREQIIQHPGLDQTLSALRLNLAPLITRRLVDNQQCVSFRK